MTAIVTLDLAGFRPRVTPEQQTLAVHAIEDGGVLVLPRATFVLADDEHRFLTPEWSDGVGAPVCAPRYEGAAQPLRSPDAAPA